MPDEDLGGRLNRPIAWTVELRVVAPANSFDALGMQVSIAKAIEHGEHTKNLLLTSIIAAED